MAFRTGDSRGPTASIKKYGRITYERKNTPDFNHPLEQFLGGRVVWPCRPLPFGTGNYQAPAASALPRAEAVSLEL
jgi:hypothetical protein